MNKIALTKISAALFTSVIAFESAAEFQFDFRQDIGDPAIGSYEREHIFEELGTGTDYSKDGADPGNPAIGDANDDGTSDAGPYSPVAGGDPITSTGGIDMGFAVLRDANLNDGNGDGKGDGTFGDIDYATATSYSVSWSGGKESGDFSDMEIFIDYRFVFEHGDGSDTTGDGTDENPYMGPIIGDGTYGIIEEYSFFDILIKNATDEADDWGLALDTILNEDALLTIETTNSNDLEVTIDGLLFGEVLQREEGDPLYNNLPWFTVDEQEPISISLTLKTDLPGSNEAGQWNNFTTTGGSGFVRGEEIPEPATLGIFALALTGMGVMQRRRNKKQ